MGEPAMVSNGKPLTGGLLSGLKVCGYKVENPRGEGLGRLEDIMISAEGGQVAYAVVSFGGVLSLGNKLFAFPWSALHVDNSKKKVILNLDKKTLAKARGFDKDHWPDTNEWTLDAGVSPPPPSMPAAPERVAMSGASASGGGGQRQAAPPPSGPPAIANVTPDKNRMEHWGESWQSHGLDRS